MGESSRRGESKEAALDDHTAAQFAQTINALKGKVTMLFITHAMPRGLQIDEVVHLDAQATPVQAGIQG